MTGPKFKTVDLTPKFSAQPHYAPQRNLPDPWLFVQLSCPVSMSIDISMETATKLRELADQVEDAWRQKKAFERAMASLSDEA